MRQPAPSTTLVSSSSTRHSCRGLKLWIRSAASDARRCQIAAPIAAAIASTAATSSSAEICPRRASPWRAEALIPAARSAAVCTPGRRPPADGPRDAALDGRVDRRRARRRPPARSAPRSPTRGGSRRRRGSSRRGSSRGSSSSRRRAGAACRSASGSRARSPTPTWRARAIWSDSTTQPPSRRRCARASRAARARAGSAGSSARSAGERAITHTRRPPKSRKPPW